MKTLLPWLIVPAILVGVGYSLPAQDFGEPRKTGKILLLKSGLVMEGQIEQVGTQMCIRRGVSEVWIAAEKAMRLSPDWDDAYAFMQTLIKPDSPFDRVKLARWCHLHHLNNEALEQAKFALELQPGHGDAKQIVTMLERALKEPTAKPVASAPAPAPLRVLEPAPVVDVTAETLIAFTSKVQPILMNTCVTCHASDTGGKFQLERVSETGHKVSTQRNLAAVLNYVDLDRPAISPVLVKAITPHGRDPLAPIKDRSAKPFQAVQQWIVATIYRNPQLKDYRAAQKPAPSTPQPEPKTSVFSSPSSAAPAQGGAEVISRQVPRLELTGAKTAPVHEVRAPAPTRERDPYDKDWFNELPRSEINRQQTASDGQR